MYACQCPTKITNEREKKKMLSECEVLRRKDADDLKGWNVHVFLTHQLTLSVMRPFRNMVVDHHQSTPKIQSQQNSRKKKAERGADMTR
jgi:hypothetical protein